MHQPEVALLDEVEQGEAGRLILLGDRHDEPEVGLHKGLLGIFALAGLPAQFALLGRGDFLATLFHRLGRYLAALDEFGETNFIVLGEQRVLANVREV
ncbi:unannotated protein [freshwater metagenome]|uniref:Unannotated protein n=1 Tax=freshwater metagenome TaxID=449393 RepID=A0A6J7EGP4_9ZZZZ